MFYVIAWELWQLGQIHILKGMMLGILVIFLYSLYKLICHYETVHRFYPHLTKWNLNSSPRPPLKVSLNFLNTMGDHCRNRKLLSWCYFCKRDGVMVYHFLLHCPTSRELWDMVFALYGFQWVMLRKVVDLLACWQDTFGWHWHSGIWICIPHCLMWCIWRERNARSF